MFTLKTNNKVMKMKIKNVLLSTFLAATMCSPAYAEMTETQEQRLRHGVLVTKGCNALNEYAGATYDLAASGQSEADIINLTNFAKRRRSCIHAN